MGKKNNKKPQKNNDEKSKADKHENENDFLNLCIEQAQKEAEQLKITHPFQFETSSSSSSAHQKKPKHTEEYKRKYPLVSICTPTFNRRPFIPYMIRCFMHQTYPKDRMEWIIIDDGTDPIEDLLAGVPQIKYFRYEEKMTLGKKRNLMHEKSTGDILVYMDDDDYYPPERVSHAVETLQANPHALCAGSSEMYIYFKHIQKMYQFGPYGPNHSTAATFAFHRRLLKETKYDETASVAEEKSFLKSYTVPFVQLNPLKTILVFSHNHNSFDKKVLLKDAPNPYVKESDKPITDFMKEEVLIKFYSEEIDLVLEGYEPGRLDHKRDVIKHLDEIRNTRENQMKNQLQQIHDECQRLHETCKKQNEELHRAQGIINNQNVTIQEVTLENSMLKDKTKYLEEKINKLIREQIELKKSVQSSASAAAAITEPVVIELSDS